MKRLTQQTIKQNNVRSLYDLIWHNSGVSRAQAATSLGISKTTVSTLVDELIQDGYVQETGTAESSGQGRKATGLAVNAANNCVGVIDWHRNRLVVAIVDSNADIVMQTECPYTPGQDAAPQLLAAYKQILASLRRHRLLGLVLIVPGIVDESRKKIYSTVLELPADNDVLEALRGAIPEVSIAAFNDTACYAYAEEEFGGIHSSRYALVNINKGIGAALFMNGKILRGAGGMATQFGHYSIDLKGPACTCGNRGCLELMVGEIALPARAAECGAAASFTGPPTFEELGRLADKGDRGALRLIEVLAEDLSYALSNLITLYNPEVVVLGGRGRTLGALYLGRVREKLMNRGFAYFVQDTEVRFSKLGSHASLRGAAVYYFSHHFDFSQGMSGGFFLS